MLETLFALGFALMLAAVIGAVAIFVLKVLFALLWLPLKLAGWLAGVIGAFVGFLICLAFLPFAIAGALFAAIVGLLLSPPVLLAIIGVLIYVIYTQRQPPGDNVRNLPTRP